MRASKLKDASMPFAPATFCLDSPIGPFLTPQQSLIAEKICQTHAPRKRTEKVISAYDRRRCLRDADARLQWVSPSWDSWDPQRLVFFHPCELGLSRKTRGSSFFVDSRFAEVHALNVHKKRKPGQALRRKSNIKVSFTIAHSSCAIR
jgi:hypothetical protein